jgi:hypothetical protein
MPHMIFERRYQTFLSACQDIVRRRERLAKPVIGDLLLQEVDARVPNHALISHIMAEALLRRIDRNLVEAKNIYLQRFEISQIDLFYLMTQGNPLVAESHRIANQLLASGLKAHKEAVLIDIGIGKGIQIEALLARLERDPGDLKSLHIVAIDPNPDNLQKATERLLASPARGKFEISVRANQGLIEDLTESELRSFTADLPQTRIINSAYTLHHTMHATGDSQRRGQILRMVASAWQPELFTLVEPNADHDTENLPKRLHQCWEHFGTTFEMVDEAPIDPVQKFLIKEQFFGREIRDIFGVSDTFRCERHEPIDTWLLRLTKAGLQPVSVQLHDPSLLPSYCTLVISEGLVRLGYRGHPLIAVYAYRTPSQKDGSR